MTYQPCPEALYGQHGPSDASGRCAWCRQKVDSARRRPGLDYQTKKRLLAEQDPLTIEPDEGSYYEE